MRQTMGSAASLAEAGTHLPRLGRTRNGAVEGGWVPIAVQNLQRFAADDDWTVEVSLNGEGRFMSVPGTASRDEAVEIAWQRLSLAAARLGREG